MCAAATMKLTSALHILLTCQRAPRPAINLCDARKEVGGGRARVECFLLLPIMSQFVFSAARAECFLLLPIMSQFVFSAARASPSSPARPAELPTFNADLSRWDVGRVTTMDVRHSSPRECGSVAARRAASLHRSAEEAPCPSPRMHVCFHLV